MSRKWIDYIAGTSAVLALLFYVLGVALHASELLPKESLWANLLVGYPVGFFGALFLQGFCDLAKGQPSAVAWIIRIFGTDFWGRFFGIVIGLTAVAVGFALILAPVLGNAEKPTLVAVLVGTVLYSEFASPSYRLYEAELSAT